MSVETNGQFLNTAAQIIPVLYIAALVDLGRWTEATTANSQLDSDQAQGQQRRGRAAQAFRSLRTLLWATIGEAVALVGIATRPTETQVKLVAFMLVLVAIELLSPYVGRDLGTLSNALSIVARARIFRISQIVLTLPFLIWTTSSLPLPIRIFVFVAGAITLALEIRIIIKHPTRGDERIWRKDSGSSTRS